MIVRSWRISEAQDGRGLMVYFDPYLEDVSIRALTGPERARRFDKSVSVSALVEVETDESYVQKHNELFLGSDPAADPFE